MEDVSYNGNCVYPLPVKRPMQSEIYTEQKVAEHSHLRALEVR